MSPSAPAASPRVAAPKPPAEGAIATIKPLLAQARKTLGSMKNYRVTMDRQERVNGALGDAERIVLSIRRDPKGVLLQWPDGPQKGREVLYSTPEGEGKIHLNMADTPLVPRMALDPLSPMVMKYSRHPITEAGLEDVLGQMEAEVRKIESGQPGGDRLSYGGLETPAGLNSPGHKIIRQSPRGQTWIVYLDPANGLPMSVRETGPGGELVEQYTFRDFQSDLPELASSTAFDPNARWARRKDCSAGWRRPPDRPIPPAADCQIGPTARVPASPGSTEEHSGSPHLADKPGFGPNLRGLGRLSPCRGSKVAPEC